jgi:glycosyltransferase involved in cell wall biosynthesis
MRSSPLNPIGDSLGQTTVDIVIIGRNEGAILAKAVRSCLQAGEEMGRLGYPRPKVIYVDSQSTDDSLKIARDLGAECYLVEGKPNPAAGRHMGFAHCTGKYVFFVDGDMEVYPGWLPQGIEYLEQHPELAGVAGITDWEVIEDGKIRKIPNYRGITRNGAQVTTDVGGGFIYRREALLKAGDFDPTMTRGEELELYLRILAQGYISVYLTIPMALHRDLKGSLSKNFIRQSLFTPNIFIPGVVARKAPSHRAVRAMLWKRYWLFLWHPISLLLLTLLLFHRHWFSPGLAWLVGGALAAQLFYAHWRYKGRSIIRALVSLVTINFFAPAFLIGYLTCWPRVGGYYRQERLRQPMGKLA